jgi:hypothetical protein
MLQSAILLQVTINAETVVLPFTTTMRGSNVKPIIWLAMSWALLIYSLPIPVQIDSDALASSVASVQVVEDPVSIDVAECPAEVAPTDNHTLYFVPIEGSHMERERDKESIAEVPTAIVWTDCHSTSSSVLNSEGLA